jgi:hypothetical protein
MSGQPACQSLLGFARDFLLILSSSQSLIRCRWVFLGSAHAPPATKKRRVRTRPQQQAEYSHTYRP